eukprot:UN05650
MVEVAKVIVQKEGLTGLYRGFPAGSTSWYSCCSYYILMFIILFLQHYKK